MQSQVRFNDVPGKVPKVPEKVREALQQGSEGFREGLGCLGAEPRQVEQGGREGSGEGLGEGVGGFGAEPGQVQQGSGSGSTGFRRRFRRRSGRLWRRARSTLIHGNPAEILLRLASQHASERFVKKNVAAAGDTTEAYFFDLHLTWWIRNFQNGG